MNVFPGPWQVQSAALQAQITRYEDVFPWRSKLMLAFWLIQWRIQGQGGEFFIHEVRGKVPSESGLTTVRSATVDRSFNPDSVGEKRSAPGEYSVAVAAMRFANVAIGGNPLTFNVGPG